MRACTLMRRHSTLSRQSKKKKVSMVRKKTKGSDGKDTKAAAEVDSS